MIASGDTDVFVCALYHFGHWIYSGLKKLWIIARNSNAKFAISVRTIFDDLDTEVVEILPAMHALTCCDTTSKVWTKSAGLQAAIEEGQKLLFDFGRGELLDNMIAMAEYFLTKCVSHATEIQIFDELRHHVYHSKNFQLDIEKLPYTSSAIHLHIHRAYLQCYFWLHAPFVESITLDRSRYGFYHDEDEKLYPLLLNNVTLPEDLPKPCNCLKYVRGRVCACRLKNIAGYIFCKCGSSERCQNPSWCNQETFALLYVFEIFCLRTNLHLLVELYKRVFIHEDA